MKKKKSYAFKVWKRKSFVRVFLGKWIGAMVICTIFVVYFMMYFANDMKARQLETFYSYENGHINLIKNMKEEELFDFADNLSFRGAVETESFGIVSVLYESETKERIAGCEEQLFVIQRRTEEQPRNIYPYPLHQIPGWEEYRRTVATMEKKGMFYAEEISMPYCYVNGDQLLPGPITIKVTEHSISDFYRITDEWEEEPVLVQTFDGTEEVPEGYEKLIWEQDYMSPLIMGYDVQSPELKRYPDIDDSYRLLTKYYEKTKGTGEETGEMTDTAFTLTKVSFQSAESADGRKVTLLSCLYYDVWKIWGSIIVIAAVIVCALGSLIAFVLAKVTYAGLKAHYDMEDYRKNLMNTMAHDLKSPLMSISGYAENLEANIAPEKQSHYVKEIQDNVKYMNRVVESVLELAKVESGNLQLNTEAVDLEKLISDVRERYEKRLEEKKLQVVTEGGAVWKADQRLMLQVMDNLLENAVKYATPGSTVRVLLSEKEVEINNPCDTDLSDVADRLCEPFVVGSKSRSGKTGTGMGLAIVKNICELQGYSLQVRFGDGLFLVKICDDKKIADYRLYK